MENIYLNHCIIYDTILLALLTSDKQSRKDVDDMGRGKILELPSDRIKAERARAEAERARAKAERARAEAARARAEEAEARIKELEERLRKYEENPALL